VHLTTFKGRPMKKPVNMNSSIIGGSGALAA
jgi:hypothetical protein